MSKNNTALKVKSNNSVIKQSNNKQVTKRQKNAVYQTPDQLRTAIDNYLAMCEEKKLTPYYSHFGLSQGKSHEILKHYETLPDYKDLCKHLKKQCEYYLVNQALNNKVNPGMAKFLLQNKHGMAEKTDTTHSINDTYAEQVAKARMRLQDNSNLPCTAQATIPTIATDATDSPDDEYFLDDE